MNDGLSEGAKRFLADCAKAGGTVTDGPVESGWGVLPFLGRKAHHWSVVDKVGASTQLRSACGLVDYATPSVPLLGAGSYEHCQRCDHKLLRHIR